MSRAVIWGAGAIGGTIGANLARAGEDALLVDTVKSHVDAMNREGLIVEKGGEGVKTRVRASLPDDVKPPLELVFLAVKSQHTLEAMKVIKPLIAEKGIVVSLQNGLNEEWIAEQIGPERTLGALVNFSADYVSPGHLLYGGRGSVILGELDGKMSERLQDVARLLSKAMETGATKNLWGYKWSKICYGSSLASTALVDEPVYEIVLRSRDIQEMMVALCCEFLDVAGAYGVNIEAFDEFLPDKFREAHAGNQQSLRQAMEKIAHHYRNETCGKTGLWRDMAIKKRKTEADAALGFVIQKGEKKGISCPLNRKLIELIHEIEDGKRPMQWENLDELIQVYHARIHEAGRPS